MRLFFGPVHTICFFTGSHAFNAAHGVGSGSPSRAAGSFVVTPKPTETLVLNRPGRYGPSFSGFLNVAPKCTVGMYTSPVRALNDIGFQLCAPIGEGNTTLSLPSLYSIRVSLNTGRPVFRSMWLAHVTYSYGSADSSSPVLRSST